MAQVTKGVLSQGTKVWVLHGDSPATLTKMDCIKTIDLGDDSPDSIDDTCLDETDTKTSQMGLMNPSDGNIVLDIDPKNQTHMQLAQLAEDRELVEFYIGWSNGDSEPVLDTASGDVTLPTDRSWSSCTASLSISTPKFEGNALVSQTINMKRQTKVITAHKTT